MLRKTLGDDAAGQHEKHISERHISHFLYALRTKRGITQKEVADSLGCSQSKISKLENGVDDDIRIGELREYASALGMSLGLVLSERLNSIGRIKWHAFRIRDELQGLVRMAEGDAAMVDGVSDAHAEVLFNLIKLVIDSAGRLPVGAADSTEDVSIEVRGMGQDCKSGNEPNESVIAHA